jgi:hypothetical protein
MEMMRSVLRLVGLCVVLAGCGLGSGAGHGSNAGAADVPSKRLTFDQAVSALRQAGVVFADCPVDSFGPCGARGEVYGSSAWTVVGRDGRFTVRVFRLPTDGKARTVARNGMLTSGASSLAGSCGRFAIICCRWNKGRRIFEACARTAGAGVDVSRRVVAR